MVGKGKPKISEQQKLFVLEYLKDFNATQAAIRAKYSPRSANVTSARLLTYASVQNELAKQKQKAVSKFDLTPDRVLAEEMCIGFCDFRRVLKDGTLITPEELPEEVARAVAGVVVTQNELTGITTYKYRFWDKGKALERVSRYLGMYEKDNLQRSPAEALRAFLEAVNGRTRGLPGRKEPISINSGEQVGKAEQSVLGSGQVREQDPIPLQ